MLEFPRRSFRVLRDYTRASVGVTVDGAAMAVDKVEQAAGLALY
jgi:hypothetical protein